MGHFASDKGICSRMRLWEFDHLYVFEPLEGGFTEFLSINRKSGEMELISELPAADSWKSARKQIIFGFLGVLSLLSELHVLIVTSREYVGKYHGSSIYKILSMKFLHCHSITRTLSQGEKDDESHLRNLLYSLETTPGLYISYDLDLTHSLQQRLSIQKDQPLWRQADSRFVWNSQLLGSIASMKFDSFMLPVIQGNFQTFELELQRTMVKVSLIARRCVRRIGTRMWRRGANRNGDVANFVETEQVLEVNGHLASYVQVRGSIPVLWQQIVDLTYKPKIEISDLEESPKVAERHFQDLTKRYGSIIAVDLVNQYGSEALVGNAYANAMQNIVSKKIRYVPFDFHHICGHSKFERLSILYEQIEEELNNQSYFLMKESGDVLEEQKGIVRTNCMDCLDRTNVTQSLLGRKLLEIQLRSLGILGKTDTISEYGEFDSKFKALWADHGDNISIQYSGTAALKGDFVRYGKRTISGILKDGYSSLARYYYNNLHDGKRQDALDLAAGHYSLDRGFSFREERKVPKIFIHLPLVSAVMFIGMLLTLMSLRGARQNVFQILYAVIWGGLTIGIMSLVRSNGRHFTDRPRLCKMH